MIRPVFCLLALLLCAASCTAQDQSTSSAPEAQWMALLLDGGHAGHVKRERTVRGNEVETRESFVLEASRNGIPITMQIVETNLETTDGEPLAFSVLQRISNAEMRVEGEIQDGRAQVTTFSAGAQQRQSFDWHPAALLREGTRLLRLRQGFVPGTRYRLKQFLPAELRFVDVETEIADPETVDLLGTEQTLLRVVDTLQLGATSTRMVSWMDSDGVEKKVRIEMLGTVFEGIACPEACATAQVTPQEIFEQAVVSAPASLSFAERESPLTYRIRPRGPDASIHFAASAEQSVRRDGSDFLVTVQRVQPGGQHAGADPAAWLGATRWLQSDAPEIQALAQTARGDADSANLVMLQMQEYVRHFVNDKNLSVGYASALEVARNRSGDCTEHALLLAALGRAAGIPTRVATGLAYVDRWMGAENVFVPHAWTQALIDGQWISYDAALGRFGTGHIAMAYGDGEPGGFYDGINTLGQIEIVSVQPGP